MAENKNALAELAERLKNGIYNNPNDTRFDKPQCGVMGALRCPHQTTAGCDCREPCQFKAIGFAVTSAFPQDLLKAEEARHG